MFGLEKGTADLSFDLEKELKGPQGAAKFTELKKQITERVESLKTALRQGDDKEEFNKLEILLHGYTALLQVIEKINKK